MIAEIGRYLVALALIASLVQVVFSWQGARLKGSQVWLKASNNAVLVVLLSAYAAFMLLIVSFLRSDFSIAYVAANSHIDKPLLYKIAATWGGHEGSMLLWCLMLAAFGYAISRRGPSDAGLRLRALSLQGGLQVLFFAFLAIASNPFDRVNPAPIQGNGLNPILQDPALALHPPLLYLGYVGLSSTFAIAGAGLLQGTPGKQLAAAIRPWALVAWSGLTAGIALGAYWAYYELGWGGWWFWDPVENASFMPWLLGAALIHSAIATERRGAFPGWTVFLALLAFVLSILGAFLVRSGVLTSVHAFALDPERGIWILIILGVAALFGFAIFGAKASSLGEGEGFQPTSREAFIGANNLLLATVAGVVLIGTIYPLILDLFGGATVSVGPPYFNAAATPLLIAALVLLPLAPFLPWTNGGAKPGLKQMKAAFLLIPVAIGGSALIYFEAPVLAVMGGALGLWVLAGAGMDLFHTLTMTAGRAVRVSGIGRAMAHAGVGLIALGAAADASRVPDHNQILRPGEGLAHAGRELVLEDVRRSDGPNFLADRADIRLNGSALLHPERRFYPAGRQNTREVAIRSGLTGDLYVSLGEVRAQEDGTAGYEIRVAFHPLIWALGLGAILIVLGGVLALVGRNMAARLKPDVAEQMVMEDA